MMHQPLGELSAGDKVAVLSPSFAAPGKFPEVFELGLKRMRDIFNLEPIEYPTTRKIGASSEERAQDLISAFSDPNIKAVFASIGGNDQITYIKNLSKEVFINNPKPFFGFSDNTHFANFLWLNGIPSYYGGSVMTQFAMQGEMDPFTIKYLHYALFEHGKKELTESSEYNDEGLDWANTSNLGKKRNYEKNDGWYWSGEIDVEGVSWGGCLESLDEMLRHDTQLPSNEEFKDVVLICETSEEIPSTDYVFRVFRALGERGILSKIKAVLVGRPKAWEFNKPQGVEEKRLYRDEQRKMIESVVNSYHSGIPIVQNLDFGHTDPQIPFPYGKRVYIESSKKRIWADF
ncbi:MAG TPA: LD-carboxypeptidase [bacterium]|nr:LD-carboxypeptidase [bacterium]